MGRKINAKTETTVNRRDYVPEEYYGWQDKGYGKTKESEEPRKLVTHIKAQVACFFTEYNQMQGLRALDNKCSKFEQRVNQFRQGYTVRVSTAQIM